MHRFSAAIVSVALLTLSGTSALLHVHAYNEHDHPHHHHGRRHTHIERSPPSTLTAPIAIPIRPSSLIWTRAIRASMRYQRR